MGQRTIRILSNGQFYDETDSFPDTYSHPALASKTNVTFFQSTSKLELATSIPGGHFGSLSDSGSVSTSIV